MSRNKLKCYYRYCLYDGVVEKDTAIKFKNKSYHLECYREYQTLLNIRDLCFQIDPTTVLKTLNIYLHKLIYEKKIEMDYILYTLEYVIRFKLDVNMPFGLIYRLNDYRIKDEYKRFKTQAQSVKIHSS